MPQRRRRLRAAPVAAPLPRPDRTGAGPRGRDPGGAALTVTCIVQARTGSTRLPGKVLMDLNGQPMLGFLLDRLASLHVDHLVLATSELPQDDGVADVAATKGVAVVRGSETDVLDRFRRAIDSYPADVVVRVTADCPLSDPAVIEAAIDLQATTAADYVSNSLVRTFPVGLDVEVVTASALREAAREAVDPAEREHVMPFVYRRPERYRLASLRTDELAGGERWTVDTADDLERVRAIVARLSDPVRAGWREMRAVAPPPPTPAAGVPRIRPAVAADGLGDASLLDPQTRAWVVEDGAGARLGSARATVVGGVGELTTDGDHEVVVACLRDLLRTDFQVREWADGGSGRV
ncbi:MAG: cytidylyltransferase domain-containing protein [Acidimicrobiales bacterium]